MPRESVRGIKEVIAQIFEKGAVIAIGARPGRGLHERPRDRTKLSVVIARGDLKFL